MFKVVTNTIYLFCFCFNAYSFDLTDFNLSCFNYLTICSKKEIFKTEFNGKVENVLHLKFLMMTELDDFQNIQDILKNFLDFKSWPTYASENGSRNIGFKTSIELPYKIENGKKILRQYAHFWSEAPFPISRHWVKTVIEYRKLRPSNGALISYKFNNVNNQMIVLDGLQVKIKTKGLKNYEGLIHVVRNEEEKKSYFLYCEFWLIPHIGYLPSIALPYIERGLMSLVKGMYGL